MPPGGWGTPWPQCLELARTIPSTQWTLVGGLMVQLHAAVAGLEVTRPTADVDIVLHVETGAASAAQVTTTLRGLGYELEQSLSADALAHRFVRGKEQIDVMIADHAAPRVVPTIGGRAPFQISAGTQALKRTVNCRISTDDGDVLISIPNTLGALVLKGAAYREDKRDGGRHLEDGAVLAATMRAPLSAAADMGGTDRKRINHLYLDELDNDGHRAWLLLEPADREVGYTAFRVLTSNPQDLVLEGIRPL